MREQKTINPDKCLERVAKKMQPKLSFRKNLDYSEWKAQIKEKFFELTGVEYIRENACEPNIQIEWEEDKGTYRLIRFTFESEVEEVVPCYLCIPKTGKKKYPVAIVLQGHTTGFHLSIGEMKHASDERFLPRASHALQAVENGMIALAIEQRGLGERITQDPTRFGKEQCRYAVTTALQLGRTVAGERMWDVSKAIDILSSFPECDQDKVMLLGPSGGGTATYYSACYDERIKLSVPVCAFCNYLDSIILIGHCQCNFIPNAYRYFDMQDLSCLIAPRKLLIINGKDDEIFPITGARKAFETVKAVYESAGAKDNCKMVEMPKHHYFCEDIVWGAVMEEVKKLGWLDDNE